MKSEMIIHTHELSRRWIDRMAEAGISVLGIHPEGGKKAYQTLADLVETLKTPDYRAMLDDAKERGLSIQYEFHAAGYLLPRTLFEEHPDYFRMNAEGERTNDWNFCVSNEEAMALFAERAADLACDLYGSDEQFYFWMDDHFDSHCHCPKCQELSPSDQQMLAIHAMLLAIRKRIPNARMAYLAYFDSIVPPKSVKPEQGVFLEYAPFEKYTAKNRADGQRSESAEALIAKEWAMLDPLLELFGQKDAKVLEYWYDNSMFSHWKKPPKPFTLNREGMVRDVKAYRQKGFSSIATFACFLGEDYDALYGETDITPFAKAINASESETV